MPQLPSLPCRSSRLPTHTLATAAKADQSPLYGVRVLDVSAGAGLCSIGAAMVGAHVVCTDIVDQLPLLRLNVDRSRESIAATGLGGSVVVAPLLWGDDPSGLPAPVRGSGVVAEAAADAGGAGSGAAAATATTSSGTDSIAPHGDSSESSGSGSSGSGSSGSGSSGSGSSGSGSGSATLFDVAVFSDVLFIALRDNATSHLRTCIAQLAACCRCVVFGFEERLIAEEDEFMITLSEAIPVDVAEIRGVEARKSGNVCSAVSYNARLLSAMLCRLVLS